MALFVAITIELENIEGALSTIASLEAWFYIKPCVIIYIINNSFFLKKLVNNIVQIE